MRHSAKFFPNKKNISLPSALLTALSKDFSKKNYFLYRVPQALGKDFFKKKTLLC
jgi:hypothetical protein